MNLEITLIQFEFDELITSSLFRVEWIAIDQLMKLETIEL